MHDVSFVPSGDATWISPPGSAPQQGAWSYLALAQVPCLIAGADAYDDADDADAPQTAVGSPSVAARRADPWRWLGLGIGADGTGDWRLLGLTLAPPSNPPDWRALIQEIQACGLADPRVVTSADTLALSPALAQTIPDATWQWCRLDATRALAAAAAPALAPAVVSLLSSVFSLPNRAACQLQFAEVVLALEELAPKAQARLLSAQADLLGFTHCPLEQWPAVWSGGIVDLLIREAHRRFRAVGILPDARSALRVVSSVAGQAQRRGR